MLQVLEDLQDHFMVSGEILESVHESIETKILKLLVVVLFCYTFYLNCCLYSQN